MAQRGRSLRLRSRSSKARAKQQNLVGFILLAIAFLASGAGVYFYATHRPVAYDPETGCPVGGAISLTVVLIDESDPIAPRQQAFLKNHLEAIKESTPRHGAIEVFALGVDREKLLESVIKVCNPGSEADIDPLVESPKRAQKAWRSFQDRLQEVFDHMLAPDRTDWSPIFESVQSVAISSLNHPDWRDKPRRLVIVSDLLQYTPEFSHYHGPGDFAAFRQSAYYRKVRTNLAGVKVTVFYLPRQTVNRVQGPRHLDFWKEYFLDQGARPGREGLFIHVEG